MATDCPVCSQRYSQFSKIDLYDEYGRYKYNVPSLCDLEDKVLCIYCKKQNWGMVLSNDWRCVGCDTLIFSNKSVCFKCKLGPHGVPTEYKPAIQIVTAKDWYCKGCAGQIFGNKQFCRKCKLDRNGESVENEYIKSVDKPTDWYCKGCDGLIFGNKQCCRKCKLDRNGESAVYG